MDQLLQSLFSVCEEFGASDVHLAADIVPRFRIRGMLIAKGGYRAFDAKTVDSIAMELGLQTLPLGCPDGTEKVRQVLSREGSLDGAVTAPSGVRYRFNVFRDAGRHAVMTLLWPDKDGASPAVVDVVEALCETNECARILLRSESTTSDIAVPDGAVKLLLRSERGDNRIRVEDIKVVTDYIPGLSTTNLVARSLRTGNARTVTRFSPGDFFWRAQSLGREGVVFGWTPYSAVTILAGDARFLVSGSSVFR